jgi:tetratricopeptide (TPR) repeat protein
MANPHFHLDETMAAGLVTNKLPGLERSRAVRHLLAGCEDCKARVHSVLQWAEWSPPEILEPLAEIGTLLSAATLDLDLVNGELLWRDIERRKPKERIAFLRSSPGHQTYGTFRAGLAACRKLSQQRPSEAVEVAQLLFTLAELIILPLLDPQPLRNDLRADAALALSQAQRSGGDFRAAESALDMAEAFLALGTKDEVDRAMFYVQKGGLLADLGLFEEALATLDNAAALFRFAEDRNNVGKVLLHQAVIVRHMDPQRAFLLAEDGLTMIDMEREVRAELSAHWTMAYCQAEMGDTDEAESILSTYRYLIDQQGEYVRVIFDLLTSRVRFRQDRRAEAEHILRGVHEWYLEKGFRFEAVLSAIDLAELMVEDDRMGEALYLVSEILPVLRVWGLHRDSLAVVALLKEKLETAAIEEGIFRTLADQIRRTWHRNGRAGLPTY